MRSPGGEVVSVSTPFARRCEVAKWQNHPWYVFIWRLNNELSKIDPDYTLIQVKEKFDRLRFYYRASPGTPVSSKRRMSEAVLRESERIDRFERAREHFNRAAVPPSTGYEGIKW